MTASANRGRPKLAEGRKKVPVMFFMLPDDLEKLDTVAANLGTPRSTLVAMLIKERLDRGTTFKFSVQTTNE